MKLKDLGLTKQDIKDKVSKYMIDTYERFDFLAETAEGMYMYDENGTPYLDFYAGIAVNNAGSRNPKVVAAVKDQVDDIMHTFNYPYTIPQALLAEKVCTTIGMDKIFYQNSGTEANEAMIKMARKYGIEHYGPNRYHIVTAKMGFHGRTFGAMSATGQPDNGCQIGFGPMTDGFTYAEYNNLQSFIDACTEYTIAIMVEPVQGEGGVHVPSDEYLQQVRALCDKHDALLIFDEVQTGVARTGKWFAYMHSGVKPDILTFAKGIGGGFPVAGFAVPERLAHVFKPGDHGGTFGGNPLACAAVYATLTTIKSEGLVDKVAEKGEYFKNKLRKLQEKYPDKVTDVRGCGLMLGMEVAGEGKPIVESCLANNVIVNCTAGNVIRIVPPLIISKEEIDIVVAALDKALAAC